MSTMEQLLFCLLLTVSAVTAQSVHTETARVLPQWLTGIIAVTIFLFLVFVTFLVNRAWCGKSSSRATADESLKEDQPMSSTGLGTLRDGDKNAYKHLAIDVTEEKATAM